MPNLKSIKLLSKKELHLWLIALGFLCITFMPFIFNFIWGNHDWMPMLRDTNFKGGLIEGRFAQYTFITILLDGHILPVFNLLFGITTYTLAIVLLATRFFEFNEPFVKLCLIILATISLPFINEITYFQFILFSQLTWPLIITFSLLFTKKALSSHLTINLLASTLLLLFSIGGYPASANLYVTASILYLIYDYYNKNVIIPIIKKAIIFLIPLCISFAILYFIYKYLQEKNLMLTLYNNQTLSFLSFLTNIPTTLGASFLSLIQPQPFFSITFKLLTALIILAFVFCYTFSLTNICTTFFRILLIIALFLGIKFSALLTGVNPSSYFSKHDPITFMVRADFYSIPCLIMFCLLFLLKKQNQFLKNIITLISILLISINTLSNLTYTKTQILGFKAEMFLLDRLTNRIEEIKPSSSRRLRTIVQAGELPLRSKYYTSNKYEKYGYYNLEIPFIRHWIPQEFYNFYAPTPFVRSGSAVDTNNFSNQMIDFFQTKIQTWPSKDSMYSDDFYNIIALSKTGKNALKEQFNLIKRKY